VFAEFVPAAMEILCDERGIVYLRRFDNRVSAAGFGSSWTRIARDQSAPRLNFEVPSGFDMRVVRNGMGYGVLRDSLDLEAPAMLSLRRIW